MSGDHDKYHMKVEAVCEGTLRFTQDETNELIQALEDAVYLLNPTEEDMQKKAGLYRVVTALEMLKEKTKFPERDDTHEKAVGSQ